MVKIHFLQKVIKKWKLCHKSNVLYEWKCRNCNNVYIGETSRNCYTRAKEHMGKAHEKSKESFIHNHQIEKHNGEEADFSVNVIKSFNDPLSRQVYEGIHIRKKISVSLNTKLDYYQPSTYNMRREMLHGWQLMSGVITMTFFQLSLFKIKTIISNSILILSNLMRPKGETCHFYLYFYSFPSAT